MTLKCIANNLYSVSLNKMELSRLIGFVFLASGACFVDGQHMKRLIRDLLVQYDKHIIPQTEDQLPIYVNHSIELKRIVSLENQVLTLDVSISTFWQDSQLQWNPEDFGDISMISLPSKMMWTPDIMLENNAEPFSGIHKANDINLVALNDGSVFYVIPVKTQSYCRMPKSEMKRGGRVQCNLKFLSWTYNGHSLDLTNTNDKMGLSYYDDFNDEWKLADQRVTKNVQVFQCCPEPYIDLMYELELERK